MAQSAMVNFQGTACYETALCLAHNTPENRLYVEDKVSNQSFDKPVPNSWTNVSKNEALEDCCVAKYNLDQPCKD